jgi:hypothetical protein
MKEERGRKMKKSIFIATILTLLLGFSSQSMAGTQTSVNTSPPAYVFPASPEVVVIPETYVYYAPNVDFDIFFCGGHWYRPHGGNWFRSTSYNGPWAHIKNAPSALHNLPHNYRTITRESRRIPYGELDRNWRDWERGNYWGSHGWGRGGYDTHHGYSGSYRDSGSPMVDPTEAEGPMEDPMEECRYQYPEGR